MYLTDVLKTLKGNRTEPRTHVIVQELCESGGGRPGLSVLTSLLVSVEGKAILNHASALVTACP